MIVTRLNFREPETCSTRTRRVLKDISQTGLMVATVTACFLMTVPSAAQQCEEELRRADTEVTIGGKDIVVRGRSMACSTANLLTKMDVLIDDVAQRQNVDSAWELFGRLTGIILTDFYQGTTSGRFKICGFNGDGEINEVKLADYLMNKRPL